MIFLLNDFIWNVPLFQQDDAGEWILFYQIKFNPNKNTFLSDQPMRVLVEREMKKLREQPDCLSKLP